MVLRHKNNDISTLEDVLKLKSKDLCEVLMSHDESTGGTKADFALTCPCIDKIKLISFKSESCFLKLARFTLLLYTMRFVECVSLRDT